MKSAVFRTVAVWLVVSVLVPLAVPAEAASPSAEQALKLRPLQEGVDFTQPDAKEFAKCKIEARKINGRVGWVVEDPGGITLRRFIDTNGDNVVDQWSYYKDGLEVYRDIDTNYNGKADQCRWFHTGGSRWAVDENEDATVDRWKMISAEEVSAEVVAALADRDVQRFTRLLLEPDELKSLGLGKDTTESLNKRISGAPDEFKKLAAGQKAVTPEAQWLQFSGTQPGIVPAGTDGSSEDLRVYENVVAIVLSGGKHHQVEIGTLIQVGDLWRVIDVPQAVSEGQEDLARGVFFQPPAAHRSEPGAGAPSEEGEKLLAELEKLDQTADQATTPEQKASFNARRAALLEQIARQARSPKERATWMRQLADMVSAAVQSGTFPDGAKRLEALLKELEENEADKDLVPYVKFRHLMAANALAMQVPKPDFAKIQAQWLKDLEQYVADYPTAPDAAEAMLQLAIDREYAGQEEDAKKLYDRIVKDFPDSSAARKAAGARTRLDSLGKTIKLSGKGLTGGEVDVAKYRGKVVLIQYWATWCEPCKSDMPALKELLSKHARSFSVIGVNLDSRRKDVSDYLAKNRLPWPQIFEEGGLDSRPANQLGILTLPTMILLNKQGKVVNHNVQMAELNGTLEKLVQEKHLSGRRTGSRTGSR